jgi:hypothetical protein
MVLALVGKARRRILHNELFRQGANAISVALAAFILLLLLGTQILAWYWAVLLPAAAAGYAIYRIRKRLPSLYITAQRVDRRLELADTLSTAVFFSRNGGGHFSEELRRLQLGEAERAGASADLRRAIPYTVPQTAYVAGALLLVASSVFALRYGLTERLDLKQPLASILEERLGFGERDQRAHFDPRRNPDQRPADDPQATTDGEQANPGEDPNLPPQDSAEDFASPQGAKNGKADNNSEKQNQLDSDSSDPGDQAEESSADGKQNSAQNSKNGQQNGKDSQSGGTPDSKSSANNQSLLSKMKEAMQNLLSSMQPQNSQQPQQSQSGSNQNGKSGKGQQNQSKQQASKGEKKDSQSGDSQQQSSDEGQQAQNEQGQASDRADSALANKQPGSGAGNRDGSKDVKLAEQIAAMGKISEIIGKRSANVTGEATIDVQSTSQQLRTGYQDRNSEHVQTGAEINRDEIPVALESYITQYFEQVRKQAPAKK